MPAPVLLAVLTYTISFICTMFTSYQLFVILWSLKKREPVLPVGVDRIRRFAILVAARNEEQVIGRLIESLKQQDYPADRFDILVLPNNCTDDTRGVALRGGAQVMDCTSPVRSKGDALSCCLERLLADPDNRYDAYCVFDADNLAHPGFLAEMNRHLAAGAQVVQGYRDSKNPTDSVASGCSSIYFWYLNFFYNRVRSVLGLSAMLGGSGFVVSDTMIRRLGGWHTQSMTEDMEFSIQCILAGEKISYARNAVFFDEQPLTFSQSWNQRMRWTTGMWNLFRIRIGEFLRLLAAKPNWQVLDQTLFLMVPASQIVYLLSQVMNVIVLLLHIEHVHFPHTDLYSWLFLTLPYMYLMTTAIALLVVLVARKPVLRNWKGILGMGLFLCSWMPILVLSMFRKQSSWTAIPHTRSIRMADFLPSLGKTGGVNVTSGSAAPGPATPGRSASGH